MQKLKTRIWIQPVALVILIVSGFLFSESYFVGNYLEKVTGTKASGRMSLIGLLKGEIVLKNISIYSPEKYYNGVRAVLIKSITIQPRWKNLFTKNKTIKDVCVEGVVVSNIYNYAGENNIKDILMNSADGYSNNKSSSTCKIEQFSVKYLFLNTFYKGNKPVCSRLPDISMKDVKSTDGAINTIGKSVLLGLNTGFAKNDGRSFWQKTSDVLGSGFNITTNVLGLATGALQTTTGVAEQTGLTIRNFEK